jgi:protein TonB
MATHVDVLDEQDSLRAPLVQSVMLHAGVVGLLVLSTISLRGPREVWGNKEMSAGDPVRVTAVKTIPLRSRVGPLNPVANDAESVVPQIPKPEPRKQVKAPEPKAIPLPSRLAKQQPKPESQQHYQAVQPKPNQLLSTQAPAAVSPVFQKEGIGQVGVGQNTVFGNRFGAYADLVIKRVTEKWQTNGLDGLHSAPLVSITFDILRDGSVKNPQIAERSGNNTLDYSALRAVMDAGPFPPLPPDFQGSEAKVELRFQLQR